MRGAERRLVAEKVKGAWLRMDFAGKRQLYMDIIDYYIRFNSKPIDRQYRLYYKVLKTRKEYT
jgi:hypothetical protein